MRWLEMRDIRASSPDPAYRFAHAGYTPRKDDVVAKDFGELAQRVGC
jgi:hypothetical protein